MKKNIKNNVLITAFLFILFNLGAKPFFGGFYFTDNAFDKSRFTTQNRFAFYIEDQFNDNLKLYSRLTFNFDYFASYEGNNDSINNFSLIPNIDLLYTEFKSVKDEISNANYENGFINYNFFVFRIGRIQVNQGSNFIFNFKGDGAATYFTIKNFRFQLFAVTDSFDYSPMFDFMNGSNKTVFTRWDLKRYPMLTNYLIKDNDYGFIGDTSTSDYNFYFNKNYGDENTNDEYDSSEKTRLNKLRFLSVMAGRIYTGFSFELMQFYFQNLSFNFLANIDLVPEDFIVTYPGRINDIYNTFGGRYTSFYLNLSASGKIYGGFYYAFDAVYETGYNATYQDNGIKISYYNALINSFALYSRFSYYFNHPAKPTIHLSFMYAHGDEDVEYWDGAIINTKGQDNNFKAPSKYAIGYVIDPDFSNLCVFTLSNSVKPLGFLKNLIFSRFLFENDVSFILRPIVKGSSFLSEKANYLRGHVWEELNEKVFLGTEIDLNLSWQFFSDFSLKLRGGVFIPNYYIYSESGVLWKTGISGSFSF